MNLDIPLSKLVGVGPAYAKRLTRLGLFTVNDLINHYPFRYDDFSKNTTVANLKTGERVTLRGEIWSIKNTYTRTRKVLTQAAFNDSTGTVELVWFNQPWLTKSLKSGDKLQISGRINRRGNKITIVVPKWEKIATGDLAAETKIHTGRLVPVYPETYGVSSKWIRQKIAKLLPNVLSQIADALPNEIRQKLMPLEKALEQIHFPTDHNLLSSARQRLAFDELFYIQLATAKSRILWRQKETVNPLKIGEDRLEKFINNLPFDLTAAQRRVIGEVVEDFKKSHPMNRLIQGEVGSGKTVVAAAIIYLAYLNNARSVLMAPTEILALQHYQTLSNLLSPFGISVGIYTGSKKFTKIKDERSKIKENNLKSLILNPKSPPNIIVGTHALLSDKLNLDGVGLIIVDEQQRFGVEQRSILRKKTKTPHFLTMTATPIPRTIALTLYGDLDISIIDELPRGRNIVKTYFVPQKKRADAYKFIAEHVKKSQQVYIITPLIEDPLQGGGHPKSETPVSAKAAKVEYERLKKDIFGEFSLGLLHGKLPAKEKERVINEFKDHKIDILISTSVVEVGVDVPNATIIVIEGAERFGLAQLHQLRGRVGRGDKQSYAFLFTEMEAPQIISRLKKLESIHDGLKLAELDMQIRGSGEIFGIKQSGEWNLKIADLTDLGLIEKTKEAALKILSESPKLDKYPHLQAKLSDLDRQVMPD